MAGVWADSFDWYTTAQLLRVYSEKEAAFGTYAIGAYGPDGVGALRMSGQRRAEVRRLGMSWVSGATAIAEFDVRLSEASPIENRIFSIVDGSGADATIQLELNVTPTGAIQAQRGHLAEAVAVGAASTWTMPVGAWVHLSLKVVIDASAGSVELDAYADGSRIGVPVLALTGVNTQKTGAAQWNGFILGAACDGTTDFAHVVLCDGSGARHNDRLGPCDVLARRPTAEGAHADFTPNTGSPPDRAAMVDDATADDAATVNVSPGGDDQDTFVVEDVPAGQSVWFSALVTQAVKDTPGTRTLKHVAREDATDTASAAQALPMTYATLLVPTLYQTAPSGTPWTPATWNAMEWGYQAP